MRNTLEKNILISGASGMIGTALRARLHSEGYQVFALDRHNPDAPFYYNASNQQLRIDREVPLYGVVNLAGANIADKRWSKARKQEILTSRTHLTRALAQEIAKLPQKPKRFLSASAIGFYGNSTGNIADEYSPPGHGFLSQVAQQWEQAALPATQAGVSTTLLRLGVVLSPKGGMLKQMLFPYKLGLGGPIAQADQFISWISIDDVVNIISRLLNSQYQSDVLNLVSEQAVTNQQFSAQLAKTLHRPNFLRLPACLVRAIFGEMGETLLLGSSRVYSKDLKKLGLRLKHPTLEAYFDSMAQK